MVDPTIEAGETMNITISLPPEVEVKLCWRAAECGLTPDAYARKLLEQALNGGGGAMPSRHPAADLDEILAPFRQEVEESGLTDEELRDFFTEVRDEVRAERRAKRAQG
jgi:hypothetical protein